MDSAFDVLHWIVELANHYAALLQAMTAAAAVYIAYRAFRVSHEQAEMARQHNKLSVTPFLMSTIRDASTLGRRDAGMFVRNAGVGPAIIVAARIVVPIASPADSEALKSAWRMISPSVGTHVSGLGHRDGRGVQNFALEPGAEHWLYRVRQQSTTTADAEAITRALLSIEIHIDYCSIYRDQTWTLKINLGSDE